MSMRMLIDARHPEETRVAVVKGNRIEEFDFESAEHKQLKGNIYLAKVTRVEPSLQAAFIDYVMRMAGARDRFLYSPNHSDYINASVQRATGVNPGLVTVAERPESYAPQRGDLICYSRTHRPLRYAELPTGRFPGHCDLVVATRPGLLDVIGGNVDNSVSMKRIPVAGDGRLVTADGHVIDPDHAWFVVLRVLYEG